MLNVEISGEPREPGESGHRIVGSMAEIVPISLHGRACNRLEKKKTRVSLSWNRLASRMKRKLVFHKVTSPIKHLSVDRNEHVRLKDHRGFGEWGYTLSLISLIPLGPTVLVNLTAPTIPRIPRPRVERWCARLQSTVQF